MLRLRTSLVFTAALAVLLAGCDPAPDSKDLQKNADSAKDQLKSTADTAKSKLQSTADKTQVEAKSDLETAKVWTALKGAAGLETKDLHVDTDDTAKQITLSGTVPSKEQKAQALTVTKGLAGSEFKVKDDVKVAGS